MVGSMAAIVLNSVGLQNDCIVLPSGGGEGRGLAQHNPISKSRRKNLPPCGIGPPRPSTRASKLLVFFCEFRQIVKLLFFCGTSPLEVGPPPWKLSRGGGGYGKLPQPKLSRLSCHPPNFPVSPYPNRNCQVTTSYQTPPQFNLHTPVDTGLNPCVGTLGVVRQPCFFWVPPFLPFPPNSGWVRVSRTPPLWLTAKGGPGLGTPGGGAPRSKIGGDPPWLKNRGPERRSEGGDQDPGRPLIFGFPPPDRGAPGEWGVSRTPPEIAVQGGLSQCGRLVLKRSWRVELVRCLVAQ